MKHKIRVNEKGRKRVNQRDEKMFTLHRLQERICVCVCVCVCEREREREREVEERVDGGGPNMLLNADRDKKQESLIEQSWHIFYVEQREKLVKLVQQI